MDKLSGNWIPATVSPNGSTVFPRSSHGLLFGCVCCAWLYDFQTCLLLSNIPNCIYQ